MEKQDIAIYCIDCNDGFMWTKGEQEFMQKLVNDENKSSVKKMVPPKRCKSCREERKRLFTN